MARRIRLDGDAPSTPVPGPAVRVESDRPDRSALKLPIGVPASAVVRAGFGGVGIAPLSDFEIAVASPYHPSFPGHARRLGGRWAKPMWVFDKRDEREVRAALIEVYGTDGTPIPQSELLTATVQLLPHINYGPQLWGVGREIVSRRQFDWKVRYGPQVRLVSGEFAAIGGTAANPQIAPLTPGVTLRVRDVPPAFCAGDPLSSFSAEVRILDTIVPSPPRDGGADAIEALFS